MSSRPSNQTKVTIGKLPMSVPTVVDDETTLGIAEQVNERLAEIEEESDRVDTTVFALKTAVSFASELKLARRDFAAQLRRIENDGREDTRGVLVALDAISESVRTALREYEDEE